MKVRMRSMSKEYAQCTSSIAGSMPRVEEAPGHMQHCIAAFGWLLVSLLTRPVTCLMCCLLPEDAGNSRMSLKKNY